MGVYSIYGGESMKVFVSWSGSLSKGVAEVLKNWIPCIIQTADVFYSPDDIGKGERWNTKISSELEETNYGIVCLTKDNINEPWINFEAGALAKNVEESRVSTFLIGIKPSEVSGPLTTFQATQFNKEDFSKLLKSINKSTQNEVEEKVLDNAFNAIWPTIEADIQNVINSSEVQPEKGEKIKVKDTQILEELVQLVRNQNLILNTPDLLLPPDYFKKVISSKYNIKQVEELIFSFIQVIRKNNLYESYEVNVLIKDMKYFIRENNLNRNLYNSCIDIERRVQKPVYIQKSEEINKINIDELKRLLEKQDEEIDN